MPDHIPSPDSIHLGAYAARLVQAYDEAMELAANLTMDDDVIGKSIKADRRLRTLLGGWLTLMGQPTNKATMDAAIPAARQHAAAATSAHLLPF